MKAAALALAVTAAGLGALGGCGGRTRREVVEPGGGGGEVVRVLRGKATYYGAGLDGGPTASGERFDKHAMTAAHRSLRFGTWVRVTNLKNGRQVLVRINDRGPYGRDRSRVIDLSEAAARRLDMMRSGVVPVKIEVLAGGRSAHARH